MSLVNNILQLRQAVAVAVQSMLVFVLVSCVVGLLVWAGVLHLWLHADVSEIARITWAMLDRPVQLHWQVIWWLCMWSGMLGTGWLFTWLLMREVLPHGDDHQRGSRVVYRDR